jgi:single-strand DNA-binding protein
MNETTVTVVGNLVDDPRLRTTDGGVDVTGFRVASTSRRFDRDTRRWVDSASLFLSVSCWRSLAGNAVASLRKGDPVVVTGRLSTRTYEKDGQTRSVCELEAVAIGPDLARGTAVFRRSPRPAPEDQAGADSGPDSGPDSGVHPGADPGADGGAEAALHPVGAAM